MSFVATVPQARRHGLATQVMRSALADAQRHGLTTITLQATELGERLYHQLGLKRLGPDGAVGAPPVSLNPALEDLHHCPRCGQAAADRLPAQHHLLALRLRRLLQPEAGRGGDPGHRERRHHPDATGASSRGAATGHFPAGSWISGETVETAAAREVDEELNLRVQITQLVGVYSRAEDRTVVVVYAAAAQGTPSITEEALEVRAFAPIDIPWQDLAFWSEDERIAGPPWLRVKARALLNFRRLLALALVFAATLFGGYLALVSFHDEDRLTVGEIRMSIDPGHKGRAGRLRAAGGLGRALRGDPGADAGQGRPADDRPHRRPATGRGQVARRPAGPHARPATRSRTTCAS